MANQLFEQENSRKLNNPWGGQTVYFGYYEQDNNTNTSKEYIEWRVLDVKDGKALLISENALDCQPYNNTWEDTSWDKCSLRVWLNENFLNDAFTIDEQERILISDIYPDKNPKYNIYQGEPTKDKVFLLSIGEVGAYLSAGGEQYCAPTKYAEARGAHNLPLKDDERSCEWWLRTLGEDRKSAVSITPFGIMDCSGGSVIDEKTAIRPAIWIKLENREE